MKLIKLTLLAASALALSGAAFAQKADKPVDPPKSDGIEAGTPAKGLPHGPVRPMTLEIAKQLVAAAKKSSCSPPMGSCSGTFAVVDDAGTLVYLETIDGTLQDAWSLAIKKARTPAFWRRPTQVFQDAVNNKSNTSYADGTFDDMTTSPGGVPLTKNGTMVGGFGIGAVGMATKQIDDAIVAEATRIFGPQW
jgi:uncharacterized protein GlcG (DUF336 family)